MLLVDVVAELVPRLLADSLKNAMRPKPERIAFASCCFRRPSKGSHLLAAGSLRWVTSEEVSCPCHRFLAPRPVVFPRSWNRFGRYLPSSHPADEVLGLGGGRNADRDRTRGHVAITHQGDNRAILAPRARMTTGVTTAYCVTAALSSLGRGWAP